MADWRDDRVGAEALDLAADPGAGLGPIRYRVSRAGPGQALGPLAWIEHEDARIRLSLFGPDGWEPALEALDGLLAAMPVQVMRGDGVRDSQLAEVEWLVDAVRLLRATGDERLADFVSDVDAASAVRKLAALLGAEPERFHAAADALPPEPIAGPGAAPRHARAP